CRHCGSSPATCSTGSASAALRSSRHAGRSRRSRSPERSPGVGPMMRNRSALRAIGGFAVSIVALLIVINGVDLQATADVLRSADPRWIAFGAVFVCADLAFRGVRWQRLVHPIRSVRYLHMLGYLLIGYLMNNVLPARLGELVRSHYLGDREGISRASALGTVVVERVVDLVAV